MADTSSDAGFAQRHLGPNPDERREMLAALDLASLNALADAVVPASIRMDGALDLPEAATESAALAELRSIASQNEVFTSYIGTGYYNCITPPVIQRSILENPGWYTQYTPYQPEISQGRLEALLNFQTMVTDLTGLEIASASLLDEGTAAAEAMTMALRSSRNRKATRFFVSDGCHPQTIEVVQTRAEPLDIEVVVGDHRSFTIDDTVFGVLLQYPRTDGLIEDYSEFVAAAHAVKALAIAATDLLALTLLKAPGELGFDVAIGNSQRFGVPLGCGGPHAAFFATLDSFKRAMPGRVVGISRDAAGRPALRLAMQTREQHIRRDKATSNICTAQVLLAVIASMYAVYHGPEGLKAIARNIHRKTLRLAKELTTNGFTVSQGPYFDTITVSGTEDAISAVRARAKAARINLRQIDATTLGVSLDETTGCLGNLLDAFTPDCETSCEQDAYTGYDETFARTSPVLAQEIFSAYHTETELLRYIRRLESRDLSLTTSMIPLGSCTMKLNAAAEMFPISWPEFATIHPFAPSDQTEGYKVLTEQLESWLAEITGFAATSLQPNAGSQGEYAGLLAIRAYHHNNKNTDRDVCIIPLSAHGTNPASAVMAGMKVVPVKCDEIGNIDISDLKAKAEKHSEKLAALMVTYPSTHGVFEEGIKEICEIVHMHGGQVYMDGANMNAQVGLCRPGDIGADVCHLNLHKTFCIPHGGGGPGVGPICVAAHLAPFLPGFRSFGGDNSPVGAVSAAPLGSASILPIPWMYIRMMGSDGLRFATETAILNANYIAKRLAPYYPVLFTGTNGQVAHECIVDVRLWKTSAGVEVEDVAKRLMDYGFHAPTMSWPVPGTMMIEPTESESKAELDRFCDSMIAIHGEIQAIANGSADADSNVLNNAPHTARDVVSDSWDRPYTRESAAYPAEWTLHHKFWPYVGRVDNVYGDRNLVCSCAGMDSYIDSEAAE